MPDKPTGPVLLVGLRRGNGCPCVADAAVDQVELTIPYNNEVPAALRGAVFERTGACDDVWGLPVFRYTGQTPWGAIAS